MCWPVLSNNHMDLTPLNVKGDIRRAWMPTNDFDTERRLDTKAALPWDGDCLFRNGQCGCGAKVPGRFTTHWLTLQPPTQLSVQLVL